MISYKVLMISYKIVLKIRTNFRYTTILCVYIMLIINSLVNGGIICNRVMSSSWNCSMPMVKENHIIIMF
jgi:hypothetical protein